MARSPMKIFDNIDYKILLVQLIRQRGMKIKDGLISFEPHLPEYWAGLSFKIFHRERILNVQIEKSKVTIENQYGDGLDLYLSGTKTHIDSRGSIVAAI